MHWFWRATIALVAGSPFAILALFLYFAVLAALEPLGFGLSFVVGTLVLVTPQAITLLFYGYLMKRYGPRAMLERETRCRKCGYILKGISEPRCSECGERI